MKKLFVPGLMAFALVAGSAGAQAPARFRAQVVSLKDNTLIVRNAQDREVRVLINDQTRVQYPRTITLSEIKEGDYVGSAALPGPDGKLIAREVRVFHESQRGTGEGHRPMPAEAPNQTMTNASVAKTLKSANGQELVLQYKEGSKTLIVPPDVPVVAMMLGDRAMLVPGSTITVNGQVAPDGTVAATSITATGKDGTKPI